MARQVTRVIDVLADHVAQVQRAVGADSGVDWAKPLVGRGKKVAARVGCVAEKVAPVAVSTCVARGFARPADEGVASADDDAAGAGVGAGVLAADEAGDVARGGSVGAERIDLGRDGDEVFNCVSKGIMRIAPEQSGGDHDVHQRVAVAGDETIAGGIKHWRTARAGEGFVHKGLRMKSAVLSFGNDRLALGMQRLVTLASVSPLVTYTQPSGPSVGLATRSCSLLPWCQNQ